MLRPGDTAEDTSEFAGRGQKFVTVEEIIKHDPKDWPAGLCPPTMAIIIDETGTRRHKPLSELKEIKKGGNI